MIEINVNTSINYNVYIKKGLLAECGGILKNIVKINRIAVIYDINTLPHFQILAKTLNNEKIEYIKIPFEASEDNKSLESVGYILNILADNAFSRSDVLIALGGGITGDVAGFAASVYLRGIKFIQIPTTLLAAVDSSVGGKTGVNLDAGKNLAGTFWQPSAVICDPDVFKTLPNNVFNDGIAEGIKSAVIGSAELFKILENDGGNIEEIIFRCIEIKRSLVEKDEHDTGVRQLLNFGHTVGHAVEKCSGYAVSHGKAVAMGMLCMTKGALSFGNTPELSELYERLEKLLKKYDLYDEVELKKKKWASTPPLNEIPPLMQALKRGSSPPALPIKIDKSKIIEAVKNDKKIKNGRLNIILPVKIGECRIAEMDFEEFERWLGL